MHFKNNFIFNFLEPTCMNHCCKNIYKNQIDKLTQMKYAVDYLKYKI